MTHSADYIHRLISEGEHVHQDFKFEISDARKIAKSISAFANTDGGRLLVGVKDNGKIAGVRSEEEIYMIEAAAQRYCQPPVDIHTYIYKKSLFMPSTRTNANGHTSASRTKPSWQVPSIWTSGGITAPKKKSSLLILPANNRFFPY